MVWPFVYVSYPSSCRHANACYLSMQNDRKIAIFCLVSSQPLRAIAAGLVYPSKVYSRVHLTMAASSRY